MSDSVINKIICKNTKKGLITVELKCRGYRSNKKLAILHIGNKTNVLDGSKYCSNYNTIKDKYPFNKPELFVQLEGYYATIGKDNNPLPESRGLPKVILAHVLIYLSKQGYEYIILQAAMTTEDAIEGKGLAKVYSRDFGMDLLVRCIPYTLIETFGLKEAIEYATTLKQYYVYYVGKIDSILKNIISSISTSDKINFSVTDKCWDNSDHKLDYKECDSF
jgi:hypothetical protein